MSRTCIICAFSIARPSVFAPNLLSQLNAIRLDGKKRERSTENGQRSTTEDQLARITPSIPPFLIRFALLVPSSLRPIPNVSAVSKYSVLVGGKEKGERSTKMGRKEQRYTTVHQFADIPLSNLPFLGRFLFFALFVFSYNQYQAFRRFRNVPYRLGGEKRERTKPKIVKKAPSGTPKNTNRRT